MNNTLRAMVIAAAAATITAIPITADAAGHSWHVLNSANSEQPAISVYNTTNCDPNGRIAVLDPGDSVNANGWVAVRVYASRFGARKDSYRQDTGEYVTSVYFPDGKCVTTNGANRDYKIITYGN